MGPTTRAAHAKYAFESEHIKHTRDPIQKQFQAPPNKLSFWRSILHIRYILQCPDQVTCEWTDFKHEENDVNERCLKTITVPVPCVPSPSELYKTLLQLKYGKRKLVTLTLFHTTGTVTIQGNVCPKWVHDEFEKLKALVSDVSSETTTLPIMPAVNPFPYPSTLLAIMPPPTEHQSEGTNGENEMEVKVTADNTGTDDLTPPAGPSSQAAVNSEPDPTSLELEIAKQPPGASNATGTTPNTLYSHGDDAAGETAACCVTSNASTQCPQLCCNQCTKPVHATKCFDCVADLILDLKTQFENKQRVFIDHLKAEIDTLKQDNVSLQQQVRNLKSLPKQVSILTSKLSKVDSLESRYNEMLAKLKLNAPVQQTTLAFPDRCQSPPPLSPTLITSEIHSPTLTTTLNPLGTAPEEYTQVHASQPASVAKEEEAGSSTATETKPRNAHTLHGHPPPERRQIGIRLPPEGRVSALLIGDSNLQRVDRRRLDPSGATCVRTLRGVKIDQLAEALSKITPRSDISSAVVHVGTNDCAADNDVDTVLQDFQRLISVVRRIFPSATVAYTAILPQGRCPLPTICSVNQRLAMLCQREQVAFLQENLFYTPAGAVATSLFNSDRLHLNERGAGVLLRQIKRFLFPGDSIDLKQRRDPRPASHTKLPTRRWESASSTMSAIISNNTNVAGNPTVPVSSSQSPVRSADRPPAELSRHDTNTTLADDASAVHLQPPASQRPDYAEAVADPSYHYPPQYGNYVRPIMPWPQVTPHSFHIPPMPHYPAAFGQPAFQPAYQQFPPPFPHWQYPYLASGPRPQAVM